MARGGSRSGLCDFIGRRKQSMQRGQTIQPIQIRSMHTAVRVVQKTSDLVRLTAYAGKPWTEVSYRIINTTDEPLAVKSLVFHYKAGKEAVSDTLVPMNFDAETDSTGCGDTLTDNSANEGPLFHTRAYWNWKLLKKDTAGNCADTGWKF